MGKTIMKRPTKWKIAFWIEFVFLFYVTIRMIEARHEANKCHSILTKTVEFCGEAWLTNPLDDVEKAYFILGKQ